MVLIQRLQYNNDQRYSRNYDLRMETNTTEYAHNQPFNLNEKFQKGKYVTPEMHSLSASDEMALNVLWTDLS